MKENNHTTSVAATALIFGAAGFVAGMLLAPKSGRESREAIASRASEIKNRATSTTKEMKDKVAERAGEVKDNASKTFRRAKDTANEAAEDAAKTTRRARSDLKNSTER